MTEYLRLNAARNAAIATDRERCWGEERFYNNSESCVRVNGKDSEWFPINSGVGQGCVASPDLFNCVIDHLMIRVRQQVSGMSFGNFHLTNLEYADDTTLFSNSLQDLSSALSIYQTEAAKLGLQERWQKTKVMYIGDRLHPSPLFFGTDEVQFINSVIYLGSTITSSGDLK
uniref:Reverse transcriptase domain-containing protein n=1 Tax=Hippocampus comes TaxID=109280 RepID=A0A3Q2Y439_HIPCM